MSDTRSHHLYSYSSVSQRGVIYIRSKSYIYVGMIYTYKGGFISRLLDGVNLMQHF